MELFQQTIAEVIGNRVGEDLLRLELSDSLGIEAQSRLETTLEALRARLLRVKLSINVWTAPTAAEIESLTMRGEDPVIAEVAKALLSLAEGDSENSQVARIALRELHAACHSV